MSPMPYFIHQYVNNKAKPWTESLFRLPVLGSLSIFVFFSLEEYMESQWMSDIY